MSHATLTAPVPPPVVLDAPETSPVNPKAILPIGTIRLRGKANGRKQRYVKFRESEGGSRGGSVWMSCARWWWINNRGPIPPGRCIVHLDGDSLNDSPDNLALGTASDAHFIAYRDRPKKLARDIERCRQGTIEHNLLRGRVKRACSFLLARWYPVDHAAKVIHNLPRKVRRDAWTAIGFELPDDRGNGSFADAASMGYPTLGFTPACILVALWDKPLTMSELLARVRAMRAARRAGPLRARHALAQYTSKLGKAGLISRRRVPLWPGRRGGWKVYEITDVGRSLRGAFTTVIPERGRTCAELLKHGYTRIGGETLSRSDLRRVKRIVADRMAREKVGQAEALCLAFGIRDTALLAAIREDYL